MEITTDIQLDPNNYRIHSKVNKDLIKKSLSECGAGRSVLIDKEGKLIAGNGVFEQAKALNIPTKIVPTDGNTLIVVQRTDLATADKKRQRLAVFDNSTSDTSEFNNEKVQKDFTIEEIKELGVQEVKVNIEDQPITEDEVPDAAKVENRCKPGDIWQLGEHRLMCGDSSVVTDVEKLMAGKKADMVFTDPPYNVNYGATMKDTLLKKDGQKSAGRTIMNDNLGDNFKQFLTDVCVNIVNFCNGAIYICMSSSELHTLYNAFVDAGGKWSTFIIWAKNTFTLGRSDYQRQYEPILYGWPQGVKHYWCGDRSQADVWEYAKPQVNDLHPTMKPVALVARAIQNSSVKGGLVLDLFGCSGTSIIASEQTGRTCYSMELDPHYCDVIIKRWENLTKKVAELCK